MASYHNASFFVFFFLFSFFFSDASTIPPLRHYVNDREGWVLHPSEDYNTWSGRNRFLAKDTLYFRYDKDEDSVLEVNKEDYDSCNTANPILKGAGGETELVLPHSGPFYYISGNKTRCEQGEKLIVTVISVKHFMPPPGPGAPGTGQAPVGSPPSGTPGSSTPKSAISPSSGTPGSGAATSPSGTPGSSTTGGATSPSSGTPGSGAATSPSSGTPGSSTSGGATSPSSGSPRGSTPGGVMSPSSGPTLSPEIAILPPSSASAPATSPISSGATSPASDGPMTSSLAPSPSDSASSPGSGVAPGPLAPGSSALNRPADVATPGSSPSAGLRLSHSSITIAILSVLLAFILQG